MNQPMRKIEVDEATAEALEKRATEISAEELAELDRRWAKIKAGEPTVPHEKVARWLETWGDPDPRPWSEE